MFKPLLLASVLALPLAACGESEGPVVDSEVESEGAFDTGELQPGDRSLADSAPGAVTAPDPAADETRIDPVFHGRWGLTPADCTSTSGDAKGLMIVDDTTLRLYESVGTLRRVTERSENLLQGDFAFAGEGMEWQKQQTLELVDDTLTRREDADAGAAPDPLRYERCGTAA
jgi:hypothetical protein